MYILDTIAAIATPPGMGGVGIIRISGEQALALGAKLFTPKGKAAFSPGRMYYGDFTDQKGKHIDTGLFVWFKSPRSFTGEDIVEFHCHGGIVVLQTMLRALLDQGIRHAEPGEFSKRAFLNGRIDLAQAESISDLISASSDKAAEIARSHFRGRLSAAIEEIREQVISVLAWIEAEIDYPEAELDSFGRDKAAATLAQQITVLEGLQSTYQEGKIYRDGVVTVILGSPNVGKSSLLNILTGEERAIVTDIPGTTRDVLEVPVTIRGIPLRLADTAGIRESGDLIEKIGIERARKLAAQADLILLILDTSRPLSEEDQLLLENVSRDNVIVVLNKTDLPAVIDVEEISAKGFLHVRQISALQEQGIEALKDDIENMFISGKFSPDATFISNQRHYQALVTAAGLLHQVAANWDALPLDLLALDLRQAWQTLGEITGSVWTENLLDSIFQRFCLGK
ncbi:MAG: tRNA uridine-5-carboxymethylaminomethyl(34) synthesis GTPase MnmE [Eubacteriales bacterium]|jgi:tRNA modification GTPase|nr:tRNA uridine-5-carboxymethylaminomethyl(34) synthesis GTPase MnmE [Eubacteriales bacterium]